MKPLKNSSGFAELTIIALLVGVTIGLLGLSSYSIHLAKNANRVRVRAQMAQVKATLEMLLRSPTSYQCVSNGGSPNCSLTSGTSVYPFSGAQERINDLMGPLPGESCPGGGTSCGLTLSSPPTLITPPGGGNPRVQLAIGYKGSLGGGAIHPMELDIEVPLEVIQNSAFSCDTYFDGFNSDGSLHCKDMNFSRAPAGQYIRRVNKNNFSIEFGQLPAVVNDCAQGNKFTIDYSWTGGTGYNVQCADRIDPFLML